MAITFRYNESSLKKNVEGMTKRIGVTVLAYAATKAVQLEATMQANRPWRDRSGNAKAELEAKVSQPNENTIRINLFHKVDYGIWLELAHEKNFAIIEPTIRLESPRIIEELNGLFEKMGQSM